jgi:tetratricopeptide (TPR) repeat protein
MVVVASAMSAAALWWAWDDYIVRSGQRLTRTTIEGQAVIAVSAPQIRVGSPEIEWLGDGVANLIRGELLESRHVIVISQSRWNALTAAARSSGEMTELARRNGVDYLIGGDYIETPDGIVLTTHIEDIASGTEIGSSRIDGNDASEIIAGVPELSISIKRALRIPHRENVGFFQADFAMHNVEAYEAYIAGLAFLMDFEYQSAEKTLLAALEIAPGYHLARYRLAQVYEATGRSELAHETLDAIPADAEFSERLSLYIEGAKAYFAARRDTAKAIAVFSRLVELYPYEMEAAISLGEAYWLDFQNDAALNEFRRLTEIHPFDPIPWMALGERLLEVGKFEEAQQVLSRYASLEPDDAYAFSLLGNLSLLNGDLDESRRHHEHALELKPGFVVARLGVAQSRYLGGETKIAIGMWEAIVEDEETPPAYRIDAVFELAGVLRGEGRFRDSLAAFAGIMPLIREESLRLPRALSEQAITHFELGDSDQAIKLSGESVAIAAAPATRYLFARGMLELRSERLEELDMTIEEIRQLAPPAEDPDRTEVKAAHYLAGLSAISRGELDSAAADLEQAVRQPGYQYAIYKYGLALLHRARGESQAAADTAAAASQEREAGDLRLDLELDRARAVLLHSEMLAELGRVDEARDLAQQFVDRWQQADADLPELQRARQILAQP